MRLRAAAPDTAAPPGAPAVRLDGVRKVYGRDDGAVVALDDVTPASTRGSFTAVMGPSGSGQEHVPAHARRGSTARPPGWSASAAWSSASMSEDRAHRAAPRARRLRLPGLQPAAALTVAAERDAAAAPRRAGASDRGLAPGGRSTARARRSAAPPAGRALGRPAAAGRDRPRARHAARGRVRRRADRRARHATGREVLALLRDVVDDLGQTVVMVTHDPIAAAYADRVLFLADGRLAGTLESPDADQVAERLAHLGD